MDDTITIQQLLQCDEQKIEILEDKQFIILLVCKGISMEKFINLNEQQIKALENQLRLMHDNPSPGKPPVNVNILYNYSMHEYLAWLKLAARRNTMWGCEASVALHWSKLISSVEGSIEITSSNEAKNNTKRSVSYKRS